MAASRAMQARYAGMTAMLALTATLASCGSSARVVLDVPFVLRALPEGGVPRCTDTETAGAFVLHDLRFFVHDVRLVDTAGAEVRAELVPDGAYQTARVALLDFEDGRGSCAGGTRGMHASLKLRVPRGSYRELRFTVGVPFAENHANVATASAPLTAGTLHWGWRGGYKFVRFEAHRGEATTRFHLGSTDCEGRLTNVARCGRPNRARIRLAGFARRRAVSLDLAAFSGDSASDPVSVDCMGTVDSACRRGFDALGIDLASGADGLPQRAFAWSDR